MHLTYLPPWKWTAHWAQNHLDINLWSPNPMLKGP
jgi:hypothetical protein